MYMLYIKLYKLCKENKSSVPITILAGLNPFIVITDPKTIYRNRASKILQIKGISNVLL